MEEPEEWMRRLNKKFSARCHQRGERHRAENWEGSLQAGEPGQGGLFEGSERSRGCRARPGGAGKSRVREEEEGPAARVRATGGEKAGTGIGEGTLEESGEGTVHEEGVGQLMLVAAGCMNRVHRIDALH